MVMMKKYENPFMRVVTLFNSDIVTDLPIGDCSTLSKADETQCPVDGGMEVISGDSTLPATPAL